MDLSADHQLRAAVQTARSWGVPLSVFLGEPTPVVTLHQYDAGGLLLRSETTGPIWTDADRAAAMALAAYEADLCPGCGHPLRETTDPAAEEALYAELAARCHRCTVLGQIRDRVGAEKREQPQALHLRVRDRRLQVPEGYLPGAVVHDPTGEGQQGGTSEDHGADG